MIYQLLKNAFPAVSTNSSASTTTTTMWEFQVYSKLGKPNPNRSDEFSVEIEVGGQFDTRTKHIFVEASDGWLFTELCHLGPFCVLFKRILIK